jgi:hypothetical protein
MTWLFTSDEEDVILFVFLMIGIVWCLGAMLNNQSLEAQYQRDRATMYGTRGER